jgi:hypothetical protein
MYKVMKLYLQYLNNKYEILSWSTYTFNKDIYINERYFQTAIHFGLINMNHINDFCHISLNTKYYHTVRMVPKSQRKIVENSLFRKCKFQ